MICTFPLTLHNTQLLAIITLKKNSCSNGLTCWCFSHWLVFKLCSLEPLWVPWRSLRAACTGRVSLACTSPSPTKAVMSTSQGCIWAVILLSRVFTWESQQRVTWSSYKQARFPQLPRATSLGNTMHIFFLLCAKPEKRSFRTKPRQSGLHLPWVRLHCALSHLAPTS